MGKFLAEKSFSDHWTLRYCTSSGTSWVPKWWGAQKWLEDAFLFFICLSWSFTLHEILALHLCQRQETELGRSLAWFILATLMCRSIQVTGCVCVQALTNMTIVSEVWREDLQTFLVALSFLKDIFLGTNSTSMFTCALTLQKYQTNNLVVSTRVICMLSTSNFNQKIKLRYPDVKLV